VVLAVIVATRVFAALAQLRGRALVPIARAIVVTGMLAGFAREGRGGAEMPDVSRAVHDG